MVFRRPLATAVVAGSIASNRTASQMQAAQRNQQIDAGIQQQSKEMSYFDMRIMTLEQKIVVQDNRIAMLEQQIQQLMNAAAIAAK